MLPEGKLRCGKSKGAGTSSAIKPKAQERAAPVKFLD